MRQHDGGQSQKRMSISLSVYGRCHADSGRGGSAETPGHGVWHQVTAALSHDRYTVLVDPMIKVVPLAARDPGAVASQQRSSAGRSVVTSNRAREETGPFAVGGRRPARRGSAYARLAGPAAIRATPVLSKLVRGTTHE